MTQDNKLILEFMGWDLNNLSTLPTELHLSNLEESNGVVLEPQFEGSWKWLMPVLIKISRELEYSSEYTGWYFDDFNPIDKERELLYKRTITYIATKL